jgi:3-deoxy-D-manno-octulosonic-acid transferase
MFTVYSIVLSIAFLLMLPLFLLRREKYAAGFRQRLGRYPEFEHDGRPVIWLHCVSVGETNAARPLVDAIRESFPDHRLIFSTTTKPGQDLAQAIFSERADAIIYFPFDWKFSVRKALRNYKPSLVLLMETEIWPRFIREAKLSGAKVAIVNGRLSEKSFRGYSKAKTFIKRVLADVDLALMQSEDDVRAVLDLGMDIDRIGQAGNMKFDLEIDRSEDETADLLRSRFGFKQGDYLIIAASTHSPEEKLVLEAFRNARRSMQIKPRLLIAPRHPERFNEVAQITADSGFPVARRSETEKPGDKTAEVLILDTVGELRAVFSLALIVFVGGSLVPHGGQSVLEPAAAKKAIITGPHTWNFSSVITEFLASRAIVQLPLLAEDGDYIPLLTQTFTNLLSDPAERESLGRNASSVMDMNRGATKRTVIAIAELLKQKDQDD